MSLLKNLKNMVMEDDEEESNPSETTTTKTPYLPPTAIPQYSVAQQATLSSLGNPSLSAPENGNDVYNRIKAKTDFDSTPTGQLLHKFLDPLAKLGVTDEHAKLETALTMGAESGLNAATIIQTLNGLKDALEVEKNNFAQAVASNTETQVNARQQHLDANQKKITELQAEIATTTAESTTLSAELFQWQAKINQSKAQFDMAVAQRQAEIDSLTTKYQSLLQ